MLELVVVFVILALLSAIALPYFSQSKFEAKMTKLKAELSLIKSGIAFVKNDFFLKENSNTLEFLDEAKIGLEREKLFFCENIQNCSNLSSCCKASVLNAPIYSSKNAWMKTAFNTYRFFLDKKNYVDFVYEPKDFNFKCLGSSFCKELE